MFNEGSQNFEQTPAINETEALEEAAWVVKKISPYSITYPVVYDFEDFNSKRCANVGGVECTKNANAFLNFVKSKGYEPMMYANKSDIGRKVACLYYCPNCQKLFGIPKLSDPILVGKY